MFDRTGLAAIGALALTLFAGLGPALGIPPALTALVVSLGFGAFLVDQLFLQGRLTTLAAGVIQERQPGWRERVARHEAGHLLVALRLGIPVEGYSLGAWETFRRGLPGSGGILLAPPPPRLNIEKIEAYCATWLAGEIAERLTCGDAVGAVDDRQKVSLLLGMAQRGGTIAARTLRNRAERRATVILTSEAQTHEALAGRLLAGQCFEECLEWLSATSPPAPSPDSRSTC